jgi:hypothetical protein
VMLDQTTVAATFICAGFWAVGGTWCVISVFRRSLAGEYLFLRPLAIAVCAFALALLLQAPERGAALGAYSLLMLGLGVSLWGWWHLVYGLIEPTGGRRGPADR